MLSEPATVSGPPGRLRYTVARTCPNSLAAVAAEAADAVTRMPVAWLDRSVARTA